MTDTATVGDLLREGLLEDPRSLAEIARASGVGVTWVSSLARGYRSTGAGERAELQPPRTITVVRLAQVLDISADLVERYGAPEAAGLMRELPTINQATMEQLVDELHRRIHGEVLTND